MKILNRILYMSFLMLQVSMMMILTLSEQVLNFIPFVFFEDYPFVYSQDMIADINELRIKLFDV